LAALLLAALGSESCSKSSPPPAAPSAPIVLAGAEYLAPLFRAEILAFRERYPNSDSIVVARNGSAEGMEQLVNGEVGMSVLMRDLTDPEVDAAVRRDGLHAYPVVWDAVAVVVNRSCPVEQLSRDEIAKIYSGEITDWAELGWKNGGPVIALTSGPRQGMYAYVQQLLLGGAAYAPTIYAPPTENEVIATVATRRDAIACVSRPLIEGENRIRALAVSRATGLPYVPLTRESVLDRTYPLLRNIALATPAAPRQTASEFITFVSGVDGQRIVARHGYAPATVPIRIVRTAEEAE
jgi:phosphate transport system substrate-binding protein